MELVEQRAPNGFHNLDDVISREELDEIARICKRAAGFDPETLNRRPSLSAR
jgi:5-methylphenazine-1-carboxylate 1-monooxygenase